MSSVVISGNTSGSITLSAPDVSGSNTATLPVATGTVMVSGNMPAFSAYQSSAQTVSNGTFTKLLFQTKEFDTNNNFASSTFTPTVAGYYQVSGSASSSGGFGTSENVLAIYKNGSGIRQLADTLSANLYQLSGSALVYLNGSTDYVELYLFQSSGGSKTITALAVATYFQAVMVRSA